MKLTITTIFVLAAAFAFGQQCCAEGKKVQAKQESCSMKVEAKQSKEDCCADGKKVEAKHVAKQGKEDCCAEGKKVEAKHVAKQGKEDCCAEGKKVEAKQAAYGAKSGDCGAKKLSAEDEFMMEAHRMGYAAQGKDMCCKSTPVHAMAKGDKGCCNEAGQPAKFKVFVAGKGYQYFGCEGSAAKGRQAFAAKGMKVGAVQKVASSAKIR